MTGIQDVEGDAEGTKCPAIDGIIDEANEIAGEIDDKVVLNAALIAAAQAVEHYEITRYGTLTAWAKAIGHKMWPSFCTPTSTRKRRPTRS